MWIVFVIILISIIPLNIAVLIPIAKNIFLGIFKNGYLYSLTGYDIYLYEVLLATLVLIILLLKYKENKICFIFFNNNDVISTGNSTCYVCFLLSSPNIDINILNSHFDTNLV